MAFTVDTSSHLVTNVVFKPSPNCDLRPVHSVVDLIVIHGISLPPGEYGGPYITQLFTNRLAAATHPYFAEIAALRVSSHILIRRDGELIQYVPFDKRAWHAGKSNYQGRQGCNDFSIGIELEGTDTTPYSDAQYRHLAELIQALLHAYPGLSSDRITGHSNISPGRKTDPGPSFDWPRLLDILKRPAE
ncbi:MAG: 1,6-anhydro-N-acetylmuramyl-L-alanine amidase AmpD [Gammaproteobacteria bacterium]|nr:1,6-anhydro-N-acetylmuramyl-L-alanine amidase AmpD [Gammaproteobacteria bacterium]